eukprot:1342794-Amphidinium_carterae.1
MTDCMMEVDAKVHHGGYVPEVPTDQASLYFKAFFLEAVDTGFPCWLAIEILSNEALGCLEGACESGLKKLVFG